MKNFNENYTMVNYIEGGTTLLFSTFDKTQYLWRYRGLKITISSYYIGYMT